jgi:hypothetical protein
MKLVNEKVKNQMWTRGSGDRSLIEAGGVDA